MALLATPELVSRALRGGEALEPTGVESLLAYRALALVAGASLLVFAHWLPKLSRRRGALLESLGILLPLGVIAACALLKLLLGPEHPAYTGLVGEDGVVEYATSACYFGAGVLAAFVARGLLRGEQRLLGGLWAGLALGLVVVSLEEISWGQRLFGVPTPELLEENVQNEMNVHNLPSMQRFLHAGYIAIGLFGALAWALVGERGPARFRELVSWLAPRSGLFACFLPVALFYAAFDFTPSRWVGADGLRFGFVSTFDQEPAELLLSLGFLLFAAHAFARLRGGPAASAKGR
ncbi:MAG TPA: hypothetical protein VII72_07220 [Myxococcota bacterium]